MLKTVELLLRKNKIQESFYVVNFPILHNKIKEWRAHLPMVQPFYAVKCNPNIEMLKIMIDNGFGFDAASKHEIEKMISIGSDYRNIIYAHPVKKIQDLTYASKNGIRYTTFDSISELEKLHEHAPDMNYLIRLKVDNPTARIQLGLKYGVLKSEYKYLIDAAKSMNVNIIGTAIHVGSASKDARVFNDGIKYSNEVLQYARQRGFSPNILDIGGGFTRDTFKECASVIRQSITENKLEDMRIIAEPGRYFAEDVFEFYTPILGQRKRNNTYEYWIGDGLYGSFNCILYDGQTPKYEILRNPNIAAASTASTASTTVNDIDLCDSIIYGSTCDSADSLGSVRLPKLRNGDFIKIPNFGAYTIAGAMNFNGINMDNPLMFYIR